MPKLLVIIPAFNESESLPLTLPKVAAALPNADILVVNDGSRDTTVDASLGSGVRCRVASLPVNLGVGVALRVGYQYAVAGGYDFACQIDADGQHDPADVTSLLDLMKAENADVVIGARFAGVGDYKMRGPRRWASLFWLRCSLRLSAPGSPIRPLVLSLRTRGRMVFWRIIFPRIT